MTGILVLETDLERLAHTDGMTPAQLREEARERLNGSLSGHPLVVHSGHKGPAMRIEAAEGVIWVQVPPAWLKLEP